MICLLAVPIMWERLSNGIGGQPNETTRKAQHRLVVPWPPSSVNHGRRPGPGKACRNCSLSSSILLTSQHYPLSKSGGERPGEESDSEIKDMKLMLVKRIDFEPYDPWTLLKVCLFVLPLQSNACQQERGRSLD